MKYTETGPQESLLSRDHYSTSNHPSIVSRKERNRVNTKAIGSDSVNNQPNGENYLKKLEDANKAVKKEGEGRRNSRQSQNRKPPSGERDAVHKHVPAYHGYKKDKHVHPAKEIIQ